MARFPYVRWTIIALFVGAMIINYLARSVLGVAAPAIMAEQAISSAQYSWITGAFQLGIMFQPVAGYLLDVIGLKIGFTLFVAVWSLIGDANEVNPSLVALTAHFFQAFFNTFDTRAQQSAVGFELGFTGATQSDSTLLPLQVRPTANQAGGHVMELR